MSKVRWLEDVADHDYDAALNYLTLKLDPARAAKRVRLLHRARVEHFRANDILRASGLEPAPRDDPGVERDRARIRKGKRLSPVLLVNHVVGLEIADGYHRVSAVYYENPDAAVPARLA